jgi:hypothetical protein
VVADDRIEVGELAHAIEEGLRQAGLANTTVTVSVVDEIAGHPETGKTRRFVPLSC